ncbi:MAG: HAD family phosphatase [Candidatus Marinimicrobia bacterium]|nr:HAD family phosphatase [Candidatus Neomarinimicrobiota bacterium]
MTIFNKAVIFDMDGVILDTEPLYTKAEIRLFREYGVTIPEEDWSLFRGCAEQDFFDLSMKRYKITEDKNVFMEKGRAYVRDEFMKSLAFMPGFHQLHKMVKQHYKIGLVTASPRHNLDWLRTLIELDDLFEHIISGDDTERNKPHPEPYLAMMGRLQVKPENTVIIEDSLHGIQSGLAAGAFVIAKTGSVPDSQLSIAHRVISRLDEITHIMIEELLQGNK